MSLRSRLGFGLLIAGLLAALPVAIMVMMIDGKPMIPRQAGINLDDLKRAQLLARRYDPRRMPPERITMVRATTQELNTLLKGAFSGTKRVASRVEGSRFGVLAAVTLELPVPKNPIGRYLNIRTTIAPSDDGLEVTRLAVGPFELQPTLVTYALTFALDRLVGEGKGEPILASVKSVRLDGDRITLAFRPPGSLVEDIKRAAKRRIAVSDPATVHAYYAMIERTVSDLPRHGRVSLIEVMRPVFRLAKQRSQSGDPVRENEAAMLAIAMVFGDSRFEQFVGTVRTPAEMRRWQSLDHFRLDGRHDFVQHFTVSMGLTITGGDMAANIIGELKEASDSQKRSGFSFTDIGADRAGVHFARQAMASRAAARRIQDILAGADAEQVFFPRFADLPEGMSEADFRRRYGDVGATEYRRVIAEIDRRIAGARVYQ